MSRGFAYHNLEEFTRAIEDLDQAIQLAPEYVEAYQHRAFAYTLLGDEEKALQDVEGAVALGADCIMLEKTIAELKR